MQSITSQQATEKRTAKQLADFYGKYYQLKRENSEDLLDVFGFLNTETAPTDDPAHPYYRFISLEDEYRDTLSYYSKLWKKEISLMQFLHQDLRFGKTIPDDFGPTITSVFEE